MERIVSPDVAMLLPAAPCAPCAAVRHRHPVHLALDGCAGPPSVGTALLRGRADARGCPLATEGGKDYTGAAMMHAPRFVRWCLVAASLATVSCGSDDKPKSPDAGAPEQGKEPVVGGKLGAVIASAAAQGTAAATATAKSAQQGNQPPETGVFAPGEADKHQGKDAPPKVDLMSEGEGNKVQLAYKLDVAEVKTTIQTSLRMGQARLPPLDLGLSIKPEKDAKDKDAKDKPKDAAGVVHLVATITSATLANAQGAPKDAVDEIAKLKGATVKYDLAANGGTSHFVVELPKGAKEGLRAIVESLASAIGLLTVPLPAKPVGLGAYWIAAERAVGDVGLDVVRFRVFKVLKIEGETVTLSMDTRQYSADQVVKLEDDTGKQELALNAFESKGAGSLLWKADGLIAQKGDFTQDMQARVTPPGQPPQQGPQGQRGGLMLQSQLQAAVGGGMSTGAPAKKP